MVAQLLGNHFVTGRAIYIFTLERQGSLLEECGLRCQLRSAFRLAGTLEKGGTSMAGVDQSSGTTPTLPAWGMFCSRKSSTTGCVRLGDAGVVQSRWKGTSGVVQTSKLGRAKYAKIISLLQLKPCPVHAGGCRGPGDGDEPWTSSFAPQPSLSSHPPHPGCSALTQTWPKLC